MVGKNNRVNHNKTIIKFDKIIKPRAGNISEFKVCGFELIDNTTSH